MSTTDHFALLRATAAAQRLDDDLTVVDPRGYARQEHAAAVLDEHDQEQAHG
ncbi:hypothetical protein J7E97_16210 [Streptomyces sp. ISL-66]|uniref:hypothetical protein n=1 Tax=Streptomyces sp. ISL-66 TaxID=2819186 RepID=UPI001BEAFBD4|nr:hypothetical protein [Streptomyces sp. ISL-66]MBT2469377.1 hypothetical protein [Streptomyces sp. ISL-66]